MNNDAFPANGSGLPILPVMATGQPDSLFREWLSLVDQINSHEDYDSVECRALEARQAQIEAAIVSRPCVTAVDLAERYMVESRLFACDSADFDRFCADLVGLELRSRPRFLRYGFCVDSQHTL